MKKLLIIILIAPLFCFGQKDSSKLEKAVFISTGISQYNSIPIYEFRYREKINWYNNIGFQITPIKKGRFSLQTALAIERTVFFNKQNDPYYFYDCAKYGNTGHCEEEAHHEFSLKSINVNLAVIPQLEIKKEKLYLGLGASFSKIIYSSMKLEFLDETNRFNIENQEKKAFLKEIANYNLVLLPSYYVNGIMQFIIRCSSKTYLGFNLNYSFLMKGANEYEFEDGGIFFGETYKFNLISLSYAYFF